MDNPHSHNHHNHVFDPALTHNHPNVEETQAQDDTATSNGGLNPDGTPVKRRPGRPKGSTKKNLLAGSPLPPKIKRPVGRPRKDGFPAGSVGPRVKRERTAGVQQGMPIVQYGAPIGYSPMSFGYSISAPIPSATAAAAAVAAPVFQLDPSLAVGGDNEWADLARTNPNAFLSTLLANLAAPNPVSSAGPTVEEAFKSHLVSLAPNPTQMQPIPSLYSILKTFWLPSSPAYFSLTASASTARTPSEHRFLYWDPQPLVFNGIACPSCSAPLTNKGRISSGPLKIYDIERPFFIVGCEYVCRSPACIAATSSPEGRKYASTDSSILRSLPMLLKDEFPARLLNGEADAGSGPNAWNWKAMGVSTGLWNLVMGALRSGLRKDVILRLIWSVQHKVPEVPVENGTAPALIQQPQPQAEQPQPQDDEDDKMDDPEEEEEEGDPHEGGHDQAESTITPAPGSNQTQTFSSNAFSDAYGDAWKENTAMADPPPKKTTAPSATPAPAPSDSTPAQAPVPTVPSQPHQMMQPAQSYNPYTAYPFTPYAYLPHHLVNGQMVPINVGAQQLPGTSTMTSVTATPSGSGSATNGGGEGPSITHSKRSPRHCCKCGSQECKGKGGRSFCTNGCQDCGKLECKGRNSRRPDKKCSEGWT